MKIFKFNRVKQVLAVLALLCIPNTSLNAENTAYAIFSNRTLTFKYGELPSGANIWDVSDTGEAAPEWTSDYHYYREIFTIKFDKSFKEARPKSCYAWFGNCLYVQKIEGLEYLNTSQVTNMARMFLGCSKLEKIDISSFDTSGLTRVEEMFAGCTIASSIIIGSLNLSKVKNMEGMFYGCTWLTDVDLSELNTSNVENMSGMFHGCENITVLDLSSFNTALVNNMDHMFYECKKLTTIYAGDEWSNEKTKYLSRYTFYNCYKLKGGNGTKYSSGKDSAFWAQIDSADSPGYLTYKQGAGISEQNQESYNRDYYDINGVQRSIKQRGLNIIRMNNGTTKKVWVK